MKLYGAIDLHSNNNVTVLIDEQDQVVYQKRLPNDLALIAQQLSVYRDSLQGIVVESTYNWYWLVDGLMEQGHKIHLANTAAIQQYKGQIHRRHLGRSLARPYSAIGSFASRLYLSETRASGARSFAQAGPDGAAKNHQSVKHSEPSHALSKLRDWEPGGNRT
jgi:hypothetical protein